MRKYVENDFIYRTRVKAYDKDHIRITTRIWLVGDNPNERAARLLAEVIAPFDVLLQARASERRIKVIDAYMRERILLDLDDLNANPSEWTEELAKLEEA